jgi:hypothetical protein
MAALGVSPSAVHTFGAWAVSFAILISMSRVPDFAAADRIYCNVISAFIGALALGTRGGELLGRFSIAAFGHAGVLVGNMSETGLHGFPFATVPAVGDWRFRV